MSLIATYASDCTPCSTGGHVYWKPCVSCQARQVARLALLSARQAAVKEREETLLASHLEHFKALLIEWREYDREKRRAAA